MTSPLQWLKGLILAVILGYSPNSYICNTGSIGHPLNAMVACQGPGHLGISPISRQIRKYWAMGIASLIPKSARER
jgi:hypothetical protein